MEPLVVFLVAAAAIALAVLSVYATQKRRKDLAAVAARLGLTFADHDPFDLPEKPFLLFGRGDGRGARNVMYGTRHDHEVIAFDYWYYTTTHTPKGGTSRTYHHFSCVLTDLDLSAPHTRIEPENLFTRIADALGFDDITFESDEFNRRFQVKCADRRFASYLIDARMIEWLLAARGWCFELHGPEVLCFSDRLRAADVPTLIDAVIGFKAQIPRAARDVYQEGQA